MWSACRLWTLVWRRDMQPITFWLLLWLTFLLPIMTFCCWGISVSGIGVSYFPTFVNGFNGAPRDGSSLGHLYKLNLTLTITDIVPVRCSGLWIVYSWAKGELILFISLTYNLIPFPKKKKKKNVYPNTSLSYCNNAIGFRLIFYISTIFVCNVNKTFWHVIFVCIIIFPDYTWLDIILC